MDLGYPLDMLRRGFYYYDEPLPQNYFYTGDFIVEEIRPGQAWPCVAWRPNEVHRPTTDVTRCKVACAFMTDQNEQVFFSMHGVRNDAVVNLKPGMNIVLWCVDNMGGNIPRLTLGAGRDGYLCNRRDVALTSINVADEGYSLSKGFTTYAFHRHAIPEDYIVMCDQRSPPSLQVTSRVAAGERRVCEAAGYEIPRCLAVVQYFVLQRAIAERVTQIVTIE